MVELVIVHKAFKLCALWTSNSKYHINPDVALILICLSGGKSCVIFLNKWRKSGKEGRIYSIASFSPYLNCCRHLILIICFGFLNEIKMQISTVYDWHPQGWCVCSERWIALCRYSSVCADLGWIILCMYRNLGSRTRPCRIPETWIL